MKLGKVPPHVLEKLLARVPIKDPRVLVGPGIGRDVALIDAGPRLLAAKTDPITFATDLIGWYAVNVNANDIACAGARPQWFLATLLLPQSTPESQVSPIFDQITEACQALGVTLVGGHTEVTASVTQPVIVGCMLGEVEKGRQVVTDGARPGDAIVLTKGIAIEGSALLARERGPQLQTAGVPPATLKKAANFLFDPGISVVKEALAACDAVQVHAMHDPTEGGLATGLQELAHAADAGLYINESAIPLLTKCADICRALGLNPFGLLASGCLIIALPKPQVPTLLSRLRREGIQAFEVGEVVDKKRGMVLDGLNGPKPLPTFPRDELARYFEESPE
ncbi:MAG: hydrogenase expression/formation protein [SAR202 cluster bacterium]|nr:hydrogenase expression/formation protein [SAR202 cluster bacterium]